jgi:hypothetical protein
MISNFTGGLADEVDEKLLQAAFLPFGDIIEVQMPLDYTTGKVKKLHEKKTRIKKNKFRIIKLLTC